TATAVLQVRYERPETIVVGVRALASRGGAGFYGEVRQTLAIGAGIAAGATTGTAAPSRSGALHAVLAVRPNPALFEDDVVFDVSGSTGPIVSYEWDLDGDGTYELRTANQATVTQTYTRYGTITVQLRISDGRGHSAVATAQLLIANHHGVRIPAAAAARA